MTLRLANDRLRLAVVPDPGACVARLDALTPAGWRPLLRPAPAGTRDPNAMGLYPLLPWSNRIGAGGFRWRGRDHALSPNLPGEPLPIHGDAWQRPWEVDLVSEDRLRLWLRSDRQPPFDYHAELTYRLEATGFTVELAVTHRGESPAPYGLGLHPWFPRDPDTRLTAAAEGVWNMGDDHLPRDWRRLSAEDPWCFATPAALPSAPIDHPFGGWDGSARLEWPSRGLALAVSTTPALSRYHLFSPGPDSGVFCFEPVAHDVDAHHAADPLSRGLVELHRGQKTAQAWHFRLC